MPISNAPWRGQLQPASFRGATFKVETNATPMGRRNAVHEFAKRDQPFSEDMGRRGRRYSFAAYVIGPNYLAEKNNLIAACEAGGPATLVHPTLGTFQVNCDACVPQETRERGGFCAFELVFLEAGSLDNGVVPDTQAQSNDAAAKLGNSSAAGLDASLKAANSAAIST